MAYFMKYEIIVAMKKTSVKTFFLILLFYYFAFHISLSLPLVQIELHPVIDNPSRLPGAFGAVKIILCLLQNNI